MLSRRFILVLSISFFILLLPAVEVLSQPVEDYFRGKILAVEDFSAEEEHFSLRQKAEVRVNHGPLSGQTVEVTNYYSEGHPYLELYLEEGMEVILVAEILDGELSSVHLFDVARDRGLVYLTGLFILMLFAVGRGQGLKTLLTLVVTGLVIARLMLPLLLAGRSPIPVAVLSALVIITFILFVIGGLNMKSMAAVIGTAVGVIVAGLLAILIGEVSHLTGFSSEEAQMLAYSDLDIDFRGLLFAGIIIGSLGAITDVSMSVASTAFRIKEANPTISAARIFKLAFDVGRDIMGTMANTLILAYVGGAIPLLLLFLNYEPHWLRIVNMDLIATEFVRGIAGSIGLIVAIPVTALLSAVLIVRH